MFKKAILPLVAVTALSAAVPAMAQSRGGWDRDWDRIERRFDRLDHRIDQGVRNGSLSRREAGHLRAQFRQLVQLEARYSRGGLSRWERQDLDQRFNRLSAQIRYERRDRDDRRGRDDHRRGRGW